MSEGIEKDLVYDVGLHEGEDSEFYLKKGFESSPLRLSLLSQRQRRSACTST